MPIATVSRLAPAAKTPAAHASFPSNGRGGERERQRQQRRVGKQADVGAEADEHEEHRHKKGDHRLEQFAKGAFATLDEELRVRVLEHEAGREGADERGQSDGVGRPGQHEAEAETDGEQAPRACAASQPAGTRSA